MKAKQSPQFSGSAQVKRFYDDIGWELHENGKPVDQQLFGSHTNDELQDNAYLLRVERIRAAFARAAGFDSLLECGGGGNPATFLADLFACHTIVDFSAAGVNSGLRALGGGESVVTAVQSDMCHLPFAAESFDAAYSANAIYHIPEPGGQKRAFEEILRTVKTGGVAVFVLANARPLAFPLRCVARMVADSPSLAGLANGLRRPPPLPYKPMSLNWMRRCLEPFGEVEIVGHAMASTWFQQHVPERGLGRLLWRGLLRVERNRPRLAARLGTYVTIIVHKTRQPSAAAGR